MRHTVGEGNLPAEAVLSWCRDSFGGRQPKVFANAQYDLGWLAHEGVQVAGDIIDVQIAEPLLNEHARSYSLDSLAVKYLGEHKVDEQLYDWCYRAYGGKPGRPQAGNIWRAPPALVGPYAEGDVDLPLRIWEKQAPLLREQGLMTVFGIESVIPRILVGMRMRGVRVSLDRAEEVSALLLSKSKAALAEIKRQTGVEVNVWAARSIAAAMDKAGIDYPRAGKTNTPSFTADWLQSHASPIARLVRDVRRYEKAVSTFINGYVHDKQVNGRVHGEFHQLRSDNGGTVVGRFSSSNPNLENIPARDPEIGPLIRSIWLPEEGHRWTVFDYSQIQFRIMTHYAKGPGAEEARAKYNADPDTDYHNMAQQLIYETTGIQLDRKPVKNINFGLAFTMGNAKLAAELGISPQEAKPLIDAYHAGLPFVRKTSDKIAAVGQVRGYIIGIMGRRHRFDKWEARDWNLRRTLGLFDTQEAVLEAIRATGRTARPRDAVRAFTHLGLNRLAQDGEGTTMKKALVDCYKAGLYAVIGYPLNIVHDDVNFSNPATPEALEAMAEVKRLMSTAIKWKVPILVETEEGPNWGTLNKLR
ncbi:DNA polymerase [Immundisolibacter sp.]